MTETTSANAKQDVDDDAQSKTATDNERLDPQKIQSSQHAPNIELTPPTNPDSALTTTKVPDSSPQGGPRPNPVSGVATSSPHDGLNRSDKPETGDMAGAGDENRNDNDHSGSNVGLPPEQSDMQVDTPTLPNRSLPNDPDTGFRPPFLPIAPKGPNNADLDLLPRIPCLYRLLDLFSERGSNGSFEKVVIDHSSMGDAMNALRDGSYKTISRINFAALDTISVKPIGIYGSKSAIVQFLRHLGVVDETTAEDLGKPVNRGGQLSPYLRSGIYLLILPSDSESDHALSANIYVVYWPEDETWDDDAHPSIQKNRVTFMRYLTKLSSDIRPLVSQEHAAAFVWKYDEDEPDEEASDESSSSEEESDDDDRFVKFEVTKTSDEDEGVQQFPGFTVSGTQLSDEGGTVILVSSETTQAFAILRTHAAGLWTDNFRADYKSIALRALLQKHSNISLGDEIGEDALQILFDLGAIPSEARTVFLAFKSRRMEQDSQFLSRREAAIARIELEWPVLRRHTEVVVRKRFSQVYTNLDVMKGESEVEPNESLDYLHKISSSDTKTRNVLTKYQCQLVPVTIDSPNFKKLKGSFIEVQTSIEESAPSDPDEERARIESIISSDSSIIKRRSGGTKGGGWLPANLASWFSRSSSSKPDKRKSSRPTFGRDDKEFLTQLENYTSRPLYVPIVEKIKAAAQNWIEDRIIETTDDVAGSMRKLLEIAVVDQEFQSYRANQFARCLADIRGILAPDPSQPNGLVLERLESIPVAPRREPLVFAQGFRFGSHPPFMDQSTIQLGTRSDDMRLLDNNPSHIPSLVPSLAPVVRNLDPGSRVLHLQLLDQGRRILQIVKSSGKINIYLDDARDRYCQNMQKEIESRDDRSLFFAVDEQTRLLAIVYVVQGNSYIQAYGMDEHFRTLKPRDSLQELTQWYNSGPPRILRVCFFSGTEDICLLEQSGRIRVFSLQTRAFRPATITVSSTPATMQSSPDGSALLLVEQLQSGLGWQLRIFHHATFGERPDGITLPLPPKFNDACRHSFAVSSLGRRQNVYVIAHVPSTSNLLSIALRISRREAEYLFQKKNTRNLRSKVAVTKNNSLVDCFAEVWDRFPVVPAISRDFTTSRPSLNLSFINYGEQNTLQRMPRYFSTMTQDFTRQSHKPVGRSLLDIKVQVLPVADAIWDRADTSICKAGEWFVELICLIPIHIAVARDNRFVPLKDGVSGDSFNQDLLGSGVAEMIDLISLGPYEAILGSYMATKPVRVVSSMVVIKGVWLSLCPTKDQLVVAMDFEGVHSLERTAQEDMLLVLFNAAISNLIMFRNNFALNRNVANMFTSFQASAGLFDPDNNPKLFKGLLAIIIKDVLDADKKEIVEEFSSKFNQIVHREQGGNFITVLHDNQLAVLPWDVIRSKEFYTRFSKLSKHLFKQRSTHANAGEFLLTLKTLMAKLTAQDWGAIDHTLIKYRTSILQASLKQALISGRGEIGPFGEFEVLKNFDTQELLDTPDTNVLFYLETSDEHRQERLTELLTPLGTEPARSNLDDVRRYLDNIAEQRILHVRNWIQSNISRFMPSDHSDIKALQREFDGLSTALLANIQLSPASFAVYVPRLTSPKCITAGPPTNVSNIVITVVREKRREFPMLMPVIKRRYVDCTMNPMIPTAVAKSNPVPFAVSSVHGTVPWATTSMGFTRTQFICASKTILVGKCANPQVSARWSRDLSQLTPFIAAYMTPLAIPSSPKMLGGSVAASLFLKIAMLPTSAKHLALSVDTFASCPTVTRKGSTKPPMDRCKKPFGALKVQRGPRLRWKDIGSEPRKAGLRSYVSCTANISAGTRTSIYVAIPLHIAKKRIQNTRWNEFSLNRTFLKIGFRIGCTGREWALKILTRELIKLSSHFAIITVPVYVLYDQSPTFVSLPCFALTSGPEHAPSASNSTGPSYCTLPIFHPPLLEWEEGDPSEHVSNDGHHYKCPDPATLIPAFHVIFVLDRSSSMLGEDRQPLRDQPIARRIAARQNNRFGAVLSALYQFLQEQNSVLGSGPRRDAYSTIVFNHAAEVNTLHDLNSPIDQLVQNLLGVSPQGWTSFREALLRAREVMEQSWSTERSPVVVFLSDGEDRLERNAMEGLCNRAVALGTPLSFWSISFGPRSQVLQEMANIARDVARQAARGTGSTPVPCDFRNAINTVQLANTFSNIGTSLRKGRASLINPGAPAYTRPGASNTPLISL
ncbi:hypothetical protein FRC05_005629 [Tulasnella sp. 425]|nr:hypothetical protein FRC05_005629 [Tulasnella sp. 425]